MILIDVIIYEQTGMVTKELLKMANYDIYLVVMVMPNNKNYEKEYLKLGFDNICSCIVFCLKYVNIMSIPVFLFKFYKNCDKVKIRRNIWKNF